MFCYSQCSTPRKLRQHIFGKFPAVIFATHCCFLERREVEWRHEHKTFTNNKEDTILKYKTMFLLIPILIIGGCSQGQPTDSQQEAFLKDLKSGLESRFSLDDSTSIATYISDLDTSIHFEKDKLQEYDSVDFQDEEFNTIAHDYMDAIASQESAIPYFPSDLDQFNELYNEKGTEIRRESLKKLCDGYNFQVADEYTENLQSLINDGGVNWFSYENRAIQAETDYGVLDVTLDGFKKVNWAEYDPNLEDGKYYGILEMQIHNDSYDDTENYPGLIFTDNFLRVMDSNYMIKNVGNTAWASPDEYNIFTGGVIDGITPGQSMKVGLPYVCDESENEILVQIMNWCTIVPVS